LRGENSVPGAVDKGQREEEHDPVRKVLEPTTLSSPGQVEAVGILDGAADAVGMPVETNQVRRVEARANIIGEGGGRTNLTV
jgi:hypothetical protein